MKYLLLAACAALLPGLAAATPAFLPTRDVQVDYTLSGTGQAPQNYQLSYNAQHQLARVDSPNGFFVLADLPRGEATLVVPALHAIVSAPDFSALTAEISQADGANFSPLGQGHYAGLACRNYLVTGQHGSATACLTRDGVVLHFVGHDAHGGADVTATSVNFGPQPADGFVPPPGFAPLNLPPGAVAALLQQH